MTDQKAIFRHLTKRVVLDKDTITYRVLARELGITVKDAKSTMNEFIQDESVQIRGGFSPTWLISGILKPLSMLPITITSNGEKNGEDKMEVDSEEVNTTSQAEAGPSTSQANEEREEDEDEERVKEVIQKRGNVLVSDLNLASQVELFEPSPSIQIYSLSPGPLHSLTLLSAYKLSNLDSSKWKLVEGGKGYGTIIHPEGEGRKKVDLKGKGKATSTSMISKNKVEDKKPIVSTSSSTAGKGKEVVKEKEKVKPVMRPMGALGGLFAKMSSAPPAASSSSTSKKRKSSPPPPLFKKATNVVSPAPKKVVAPAAKKVEVKAPKKKTKIVSNGIFGDEEVTDDGESDNNEEEEEIMIVEKTTKTKVKKEEVDEEAEEAMREIEDKEKVKERKVASQKKKKELIARGQSGKPETSKEKEKRELEIMMMSDDDDEMEVDIPAPKAKVVAKPAAKKSVEQPQKNMQSFFGKK